MTIRDMLDQGITIQGKVRIQLWDDSQETYIVYLETNDFGAESISMSVLFLDMEIDYQYCNSEYLVFEVVE